jgi:hypothetical protein
VSKSPSRKFGRLNACPTLPGRDVAFAVLALLRCRDRIAPVLDAVAEPRRNELAKAIAEHEALDSTRLKQLLAELIRREDAELSDGAMRALGIASSQVPRAILRWIARAVAP